jgi:hypothetical protein
MKHRLIQLGILAVLVLGCGKSDPEAQWFTSPTKVVEGLMHAYETRNDSLYAALLAEDFRYYFEPAGTDSLDILGWGKEEEVVATGNLFRTPDVESLRFRLEYDQARGATGSHRDGWMLVPVRGGELVVSVRDKEPMQVALNRQELVMRPARRGKQDGWEIVEWHDYPAPPAEMAPSGGDEDGAEDGG